MAESNIDVHQSEAPSLDVAVFVPSGLLVLLVGISLVAWPEEAAQVASTWMNAVTTNFGWLFSLVAFLTLIFCFWLAFGKYGQVKLGQPGDTPEFSEISWAGMMFSAGIGIGLVSWAFVEPIFYFQEPPLGITGASSQAAEWAHMYTMFHWGFVPWALYALPTIPIAYMLYVRQSPFLRISHAVNGAIPKPQHRKYDPLIDTLVIIGIVGGAGTSLGLGVPLVSAFVGELFGLKDGFGLQILVLTFWTLIFATSVYRGLKSGIQWLASINIGLAILVLVFILLIGPTIFILTLSANSFGLLIDNFFRMSFWLDPIEQSDFPRDWTLFYWAWWIAYAPLMGLFFGRISRGRTIKQTILGIIGWGSLGCVLFMSICGAYALHLEINDILPVSEILNKEGNPAAVVAIVSTLPAPTLAIAVFTVLSFIFLATTLDSVAYVLASITTKNLPGDEEPERLNRLVWAFFLAFIAVGLLVVGGLTTVQSSSVVTSLPLIPVMFLLAVSILKWLEADFGNLVNRPILSVRTLDDGRKEIIKE